MPKLIVQLNHPGNQKAFVLGKGYQKVNDLIIREWNDDPFFKSERNCFRSFQTTYLTLPRIR